MTRTQIAPGTFLTEVPGGKFKRCRIAVSLVLPGGRRDATELALLPHVLTRRCDAVPDATALSRLLFSMYGAELSGDSYMAGANRVVSIGVSGLKNGYAPDGEDLQDGYLSLLCSLLFAPKLSGGVFEARDVDIEKDKQADFLRSEMNDKRVYCLRQARRKLYGASPLGIESAGYLEDIGAVTPRGLYETYGRLLRTARAEIYVCGADAHPAARRIAGHLDALGRGPAQPASAAPIGPPAAFERCEEHMDTAQGKLCLMFTTGRRLTPRADAEMRVACAILGGLPTSRLFVNVREKQGLCYYCAAAHGPYGGVLTVDLGVDRKNARRAAEFVARELARMQAELVGGEELEDARRCLCSSLASVKDSPDALVGFAQGECLLRTHRTLEEMDALFRGVSAEDVRAAMAACAPALEYLVCNEPLRGAGRGDGE